MNFMLKTGSTIAFCMSIIMLNSANSAILPKSAGSILDQAESFVSASSESATLSPLDTGSSSRTDSTIPDVDSSTFGDTESSGVSDIENSGFEDIHVAFVSDQNYPMPICVSMASMLSHSTKNEKLNFHIVDLGIRQIDKDRIWHLKYTHGDFNLEFIPYDKNKVSQFQSYNWSPAIYAKLLLGDVLPNVSKCLLIDGDTIANQNIRKLYDIDLKDNYVAIMNNYSFTNRKYCTWLKRVNAGSILMNLDLIRRDGMQSKFLTCLACGQSNIRMLPREGDLKMTFTEEHAIQEACAGKIYNLPLRYNFLNYMIYTGFDGTVSQQILDANAQDKTASYILNELKNAVIYHYSDMPKIWNTPEHEWYRTKKSKYMRDLWYRHYAITQYAGK